MPLDAAARDLHLYDLPSLPTFDQTNPQNRSRLKLDPQTKSFFDAFPRAIPVDDSFYRRNVTVYPYAGKDVFPILARVVSSTAVVVSRINQCVKLDVQSVADVDVFLHAMQELRIAALFVAVRAVCLKSLVKYIPQN